MMNASVYAAVRFKLRAHTPRGSLRSCRPAPPRNLGMAEFTNNQAEKSDRMHSSFRLGSHVFTMSNLIRI